MTAVSIMQYLQENRDALVSLRCRLGSARVGRQATPVGVHCVLPCEPSSQDGPQGPCACLNLAVHMLPRAAHAGCGCH
jgi:hypothetical protein